MQTIQTQAQQEFQKRFGKEGQNFFCPGRVNLIGEHIDYNGGLVLPAAISKGIYAVAALNGTNFHTVYSLNFPESEVRFSLEDSALKENLHSNWAAFVAGTFLSISTKANCTIPGLDILFSSDLPQGCGLSSSAAIEVLSGFVAAHFAGINFSRKDLALLCCETERNFIGVNCGIMDQYVVANAEANHALLLNCNTISHQAVPVNFASYSLLILNTNKPRKLVESKYNERRAECNQALAIINQHHSYSNLCEAQEQDLALIDNPTLLSRAKHVITEHLRVLNAAKALQAGNIIQFGHLLTTSHHSLRYDYEVSCIELDVLCDFANAHPHCIGARMTGAGFGGCAIALVESQNVPQFSLQLKAHYYTQTQISADVFECDLVEGVRLFG